MQPDAVLHINDSSLGKFDLIGKVLFFIECLAVGLQLVLFLSVGVAVSSNESIFKAGLAVMTVFLFVHALSVLWLVERTITTITQSVYKHASDEDLNHASNTRRRAEIAAITRKMREQQGIIFLFSSTGWIIYILILSDAIQSSWYVMLIHMYEDLIANLVIVFSMGRKSTRQHVPTDEAGVAEPTTKDAIGENTATTGAVAVDQAKTRGKASSPPSPLSSKASTVQPTVTADPQSTSFMMVYQSGAYDEEDDELKATGN